MSEMGQVIGVDNSAMTRLVDRLEKSGLVKRQIDPENTDDDHEAQQDGSRREIKLPSRIRCRVVHRMRDLRGEVPHGGLSHARRCRRL